MSDTEQADKGGPRSGSAKSDESRKSSRMILRVMIGLLIVAGAAAYLNFQGTGRRLTLAANAEILLKDHDQQVFTVTPALLDQLGPQEFKASLNSDGKEPEQHVYTGVPLKDVIAEAKISLQGARQVDILSADGYMVALPVNEVKAENNIYLVTKDNGSYLGTIDDKNGRGPYMIVIRRDPFSQRWSKYVCEINVK